MKSQSVKSRIILIGMSVMVLISICEWSFAQIYKWVDDKGIVHFTDDVSKIPEKYRSSVPTEPKTIREEKGKEKDWDSMTYDEKMEHMRKVRIKAKVKEKEDRELGISRQPKHIQTLIRNQDIKLGMTQEQVLLSWGEPVKVNRSVGK